ncbi:UDP-glucuronosyltransferase 2C1 [Folsomia candida]|uniref:UDP-glucuronosyltransferase 2B9 n=1 Tax=Folsomia candida TaxID=158441 RepID=A0A226DN35_FOLCA|nr:UDP-glucuronosyltransferase 2C1 [Folsomia candida]OXA46599.1 UDP-glucuronosyltransferase 2B9 [Folsomia candida]
MNNFRNGAPFKTGVALFLIILGWGFELGSVEGRNILAVEFFGSKSHVITYLPLLEELARKGDKVTLLSPSKGLTKEPNITEIFGINSDAMWKEYNLDLFAMKERNEEMNPWTLLTQIVPKGCREIYERPEVKALYDIDFDLILLQPLFNDCALGFIHKIMTKSNATTPPLVLFLPLSAPNFVVSKLGGYHPSSFVSNTFVNFGDDMTFYERFLNFGINIMFDAAYTYYYLPVMEELYREKVGSETPGSGEILGKASMILSNGHFALARPKPNLPDVVDVGGIHSRKAKPLPKDLEDFIASSGDAGFILFSLGTNLVASKMAPEKRAIFLNVFGRLKQKVIWKYETDDVSNVPKNVLLSKWLPQQDLLGHGKIRLFMTHCGGGGTEEAIFHGVPLLGMPFFGDQPLNAQAAEKHGYLVRLDWNDLTEESLTKAINEVINNPKYRENVHRLSTVFRDQIDNPLDRGMFWLEYVMRHKGAPQLRSPARNLSSIQYHSLDVIAAYLAIILGTLFAIYAILRRIYTWCVVKISGNSYKQKTS